MPLFVMECHKRVGKQMEAYSVLERSRFVKINVGEVHVMFSRIGKYAFIITSNLCLKYLHK